MDKKKKLEKEKKEKKEFQVVVDQKRCKSCGICVALCPKSVLELTYPEFKCEPVRMKDCIGCLMCELHCPDFAIVCNPKESGKGVAKTDEVESGKERTDKVKRS
jgi:2-oxoglutarate ferredoxin oxidoreductase subunit delta